MRECTSLDAVRLTGISGGVGFSLLQSTGIPGGVGFSLLQSTGISGGAGFSLLQSTGISGGAGFSLLQSTGISCGAGFSLLQSTGIPGGAGFSLLQSTGISGGAGFSLLQSTGISSGAGFSRLQSTGIPGGAGFSMLETSVRLLPAPTRWGERAEARCRLKSAPRYKLKSIGARGGAWFAGLVLSLFSPVWGQQTAATEEILRHAVELHQKGEVAAAIPEYRAYLKQVPDNPIALSNLGAALAHAGLYEEAIVEYKHALKLQPGNVRVRLNLALAYYKASEISSAAEEAERVLASQPTDRQAIFLLADCDLRLGENKKVIDLLTPLESQMAGDNGFNYMLGTALIRDKQTGRGQLLVDRILRVGDSAEARLMMGESKMSIADFKGALEDFQKAVELNAKLPDVYSYYGMALAATGDTPQAAVAFRKELDSNPNDYTSNVQLGILLKQDEDYAGSRHCFEQALAVRPRDGAARYQLATLDLQSGAIEKARTELESLTKEIPHFVEAHVSLATVYYRLKRREDGDKERAIVLELNAKSQAAQPGATAK